MKLENLKTKKIFFAIFAAFIVASFSFLTYSLMTGGISFAQREDVWDGESVATSFSAGNGSEENPYLIKTEDEFLYFKQLIEGDQFTSYQDKYYALDDDLDFGEHSITGIGIINEEEERIFKGHLDGRGHSINRIKIDKPTTIEETDYYGLFIKTKDAEIENLQLKSYQIVAEESKNKTVVGGISGELLVSDIESEETLSHMNNVSIVDFLIDVQKIDNEDVTVGSLTTSVPKNTEVERFVSMGTIKGNNKTKSIGVIPSTIEGTVKNVYTNILLENTEEINLENDDIENHYIVKDNEIYLNGETVSEDNFLLGLNDENNDYYWERNDNEFILKEYEKAPEVVEDNSTKNFSFSIRRAAASFSVHDSGRDGNIVYVNDLTSDLNYYNGLNYTTSDTDTPNMDDKGLYSNSNLVKFEIIYHGDTDSLRTGTISYENDENQNTMIYYKYYPVNGNSIDIELIDNPFSGRPDDMAFNGWYSEDNDITLYIDPTYYTWHAIIPMNGETEKVVELYASWVEATMARTRPGTGTSSIQTALGSLKNAGITTAETSEQKTRLLDIIGSDRYYYTRVILNRGDSRVGYYDNYGDSLTGTCNNNTCTVYHRETAGDPFVEGTNYYYTNGYYAMSTIDPRPTEYYWDVKELYQDMNMAGYYEPVPVARNESLDGLYDSSGVLLSGNCTSSTCNVYRKITYLDGSGNPNIIDPNKTYYYLVTRDTNIVYMNYATSTTWSTTKPFTLTSYYNGVDSRDSAYFDMRYSYLRAVADTRIEYIRLYSDETGGTSSGYLTSYPNEEGYIYGNQQNLKIGRGITKRGNSYRSAIGVVGGSNTSGTRRNQRTYSNTKYKLEVESGHYTYAASMEFPTSYVTYNNPNIITVWGNDYDRVTEQNDNFDIYKTLYGNMAATVSCSPASNHGLTQIIKSGVVGSNTDNTDNTLGIYATSNYSGTFSCESTVLVEDGKINNIYGGPGPTNSLQNYNAVHIYFKDGEADTIFGGGAYLTSYGNRIIQVTGGKVNYSVVGGSNGYRGDESQGSDYIATLNGDAYVYVGGSCTVGDADLIENKTLKFAMESGSVFGVANGKSSSTRIGSADNSYVVINGGTILNNVYGGGNYGATASSKSSGTYEAKVKVLSGTITNSVYGGGNNNGAGTTSATVNTTIDVLGGTIKGSVYGGSKTKGTIYGGSTVNIAGGTIEKDVYGGGEGGYTNNNNPGTYVRGNVEVTVSNGTISGSVYGGSAYGTVNAINQTTNTSSYNTTVHVTGGVVQNSVFGGAKGDDDYTPKVVGNITVTIDGGSIGKVFGGFDASGKPSHGDVVYLNGGTIGNAFGGGNNANQDSTDIRLQGSTITGNLYGGSNLLGTVTQSNVTVTSGSVTEIYGGNNMDGMTVTTNVNVTGATITGDIYGGGNEATSTTSNVTISGYTRATQDVYGGGKNAGVTTTNVDITNSTVGSVYGGSNIDGEVTTSNVELTSTTATAVYGGNNQGGTTTTTYVDATSSTITNVFGGGDNASSGTSNVTIHSGTITNLYGGGNEAGLTTANVTVEKGTITNVFGGSNKTGDIDTTNIQIGNTSSTMNDIYITNLYGGNNEGGTTTSTNIDADIGNIDIIYGGGNKAPVGSTNVVINDVHAIDIYGGGNAAGVNGDTTLDINSTTATGNVFGGGNEGVVTGSTTVTITDTTIQGNAYAGGNGSTAVVQQNSTITIDGASEIGTATSTAPSAGCVFGSGNAASTGIEGVDTSKATVNIVGAKIHGNVYGGAKMAGVYGTTDTNIGTSAVSTTGLKEDDIIISGTVFGGSESNESGSGTYDWNFISVTNGITVDIDGTGYENNSHEFVINGSIFGSGNASSSSGTSEINIKNLGTRNKPNKSVSIQRANNLVIDHSVIELSGATDRTNEFSDIEYSFNMIDKLVFKNDSVLLLQHNANMLKELYSGVDSGGSLTPAVVDIDDDNQTVTKNVDNRIYMIPGQNLNITVNQGATAYGKVTGMTFFGMYNSYDNGTYRFGLYDDDYTYGDTGNASLEIIGGSYAIGRHHENHDITKDGFYSNYLDEETLTEISTAYINPSPIGTTGYRWTVGFDAINYEFTLTASKYSSLGTYELQLIDFTDGDTIFTVLGFDSSGLNPDLSLVDSNSVPRVGSTETEANTIFGLSMKSETQEWTGYGTTKMYSRNGGKYDGDEEYRTDSRKLPPSLMFYLYHAKNITCQGKLGTVVLTLQAAVPKNAIDYDIKFITVTINLTAINDESDSYDAAITYDKKYELPSSTSVNITNQSQFTTYFSLTTFKDEFAKVYGNNNENVHVLVTNNPLPVNTMITMMDFSSNPSRPEYYYFKVTQSVYNDSVTQLNQYNEVTYRLNQFIKMDSTSTNNTYDDATNNLKYYDNDNHFVDEEFMFIFDFKECTQVTGNHLNNTILFELRNSEDRTVFNVLGIREGLMVYNTYESSNVVLKQTITDTDEYLYYNVADEFNYSTEILYNQTGDLESVIDTNYESSKMGLNVEFYDKDDVPVSSSLLLGTSIKIGNQEYFAGGDGIFRIKLANKVSNLIRAPKLTINKDLPAGDYTIRYILFASDDGLHNSGYQNSVQQDFLVHVVSADNSITVDCDDKYKVVDGDTGLNMNSTSVNIYKVKYQSQLNNPNFRIEVFKRNIENPSSTGYTSVPFSSLFTNSMSSAGGNEVYFSMDELNEKNFNFQLQESLTSGTYRVVFKLYDNNQLIDDEVKYVIVSKKTE